MKKIKKRIQKELKFIINEAGLPMRGSCTDAHSEWMELQMNGIVCYPNGEDCSAVPFEEQDQKDDVPDEVVHTSGNSPEAAATANGRFLSKTHKRALVALTQS